MKKIAAAFIAGVVFASASSVFAGEAIKKVQAVLAQDVTVKVDGEKVKLQNTPITYGGATYLPVRDAANAVGAELQWDSKTKTVELKTEGGQQKETPVKTQEPQATVPQTQPEQVNPATGQNPEGGKESLNQQNNIEGLYVKIMDVYSALDALGYAFKTNSAGTYSLIKYEDAKSKNANEYSVVIEDVPTKSKAGISMIPKDFYDQNILHLLK